MCVPNSPLFQRCQVYDKPPFSKKKINDWPSFSSLIYEWSRFLTSLFENTHIFAQIFSSETKIVIFICELCSQIAKRGIKSQRTVYEYVTFCSIKYMNMSFLSKTKYMIGVGVKKLARTPVPNLSPSYPRGHTSSVCEQCRTIDQMYIVHQGLGFLERRFVYIKVWGFAPGWGGGGGVLNFFLHT